MRPWLAAPAEVRGLNAVCATIGKSTFPDNFDDKVWQCKLTLSNLR